MNRNGSSEILVANLRMFFVLEGLFDNSPAIYRWGCREIHERVLEGRLKLAVRWLKFSRPSRTRVFYRFVTQR